VLIDRLRQASKEFGKVAKTTRGKDAELDRLRALMRESQYVEAVTLLAKIVPFRLSSLTDEHRQEVIAAANLAGAAVFGKRRGPKTPEDLANVLVFDPKLDKTLGPLTPQTVWVMGSRFGLYGYEIQVEGKPHGVFTYHLADTLRDPSEDTDGDGRISLLEATVAAGRRILKAGNLQTPTVAGDAARVAMFASSKRTPSKTGRGTLHALLVGVGKHSQRMGSELLGPANDVAVLRKLLGTRERRLFQRVDIRGLLDKQATKARIFRVLGELCKAAKRQDTLLFYFSGQGSRDDPSRKEEGGQIWLLAYDIKAKDGSMINHRDILGTIAVTKAERKIVILDF
jgi:hypothetical protein